MTRLDSKPVGSSEASPTSQLQSQLVVTFQCTCWKSGQKSIGCNQQIILRDRLQSPPRPITRFLCQMDQLLSIVKGQI